MKREDLEKLNKNELIDIILALVGKVARLEARLTKLIPALRGVANESGLLYEK